MGNNSEDINADNDNKNNRNANNKNNKKKGYDKEITINIGGIMTLKMILLLMGKVMDQPPKQKRKV